MLLPLSSSNLNLFLRDLYKTQLRENECFGQHSRRFGLAPLVLGKVALSSESGL